MVAAGVGDHAAGDLGGRQLENLVGRAADFEGADGLETFRLEPDSLACSVAGEAGEGGFNHRRFDGDAGDAGCCGADFSEGNQRFRHAL